MVEIVMLPVASSEVRERQVFNTGVSTVGRDGNDYFCSQCGRMMIHNMDLSRIDAPIVYACGGCGALNEPPPAA